VSLRLRRPGAIIAIGLAAVLAADVAVAVIRLPADGSSPTAGQAPTAEPTLSATPTPTRSPRPPLRGVPTKRLRYAGLVHFGDLPRKWERAHATATAHDRLRVDRALSGCLGVHPLARDARTQRHRSYDDYPSGFDAIDSSTYVVGAATAQAYFAATENGAGLACVRRVERHLAQPPAGAHVVGTDSRALPTPPELFGTRTTVSLRAGGKTFATYDDGVVFVAGNVVVVVHFLAAGAPPQVSLEQQLLQTVLNRINRLARRGPPG
jgi:hypothetical protein